MRYVRAMLVCAGCDEQVWDRNAVVVYHGQLSLRPRSDGERLGVHTQLTERGEIAFQPFEVAL